MDILVFGAGAVGSYLGGRLSGAGHRVTLVAREQSALAIGTNGLAITEKNTTAVSHPVVVTTLRQAFLDDAAYDLILLTMKAYDAEVGLNELAAFCPFPPKIMTLQNGIGVEDRFADEFGAEQVIAGSLTTPLSRQTSHHVIVERADRGLALAPTQARQSINQWVELFESAGVSCEGLKNYQSMKWSKAMLNMIGNATSAILNRHPKIVYSYGPIFSLEMAMLKETLAVMNRKSIKPVDLPGTPTGRLVLAVKRLPDALVQPILTKIVSSGRGEKMPSFHIDLANGKEQNEVLYHNGAVAAAGQSQGVPTPVNTALNDILLKLVRKEIDFETYNGKPKRLVAEVQKYRQQVGMV
jgi:2-dehydropantoate 2-reductase